MASKNEILIYHIPEVPDPSDPKYQQLAAGDVRSVIATGCEHMLRTLAHMLPNSCSAELRFIFEPEGDGQDSQSRLNLYLLLWASNATMARNLDGLVRGGPLSHFYRFVKIEKLPKAKVELFSSCDIVRRENLIAPLHTPDLNFRIPEHYYTVSPLVPNESNDYLPIDRILDRTTEPVTISIKVQSVDTSKQLHAHTRYLARLTDINHNPDIYDESFRSVDYTGSGDHEYLALRNQFRPLAYKDPLANDILRAQREIQKLLFKPLLFFRIRVAAQTEPTAHLVCSVLAESAFDEGGYCIVVNSISDDPIDGSDHTCQESGITCCRTSHHVDEDAESEGYEELRPLVRLATVEELLGIFGLPVASARPLCCRKNTDPPHIDQENLIVLGCDDQCFTRDGFGIHRGVIISMLRKHFSCFGLPGTGKTTNNINLLCQLSRRGIPFLVIECAKKEYRVLKMFKEHAEVCFRELAQKLEVFTPGAEKLSAFRFNPLERPPGIEVVEHIENLRSCFKASIPVSAGSLPALLGEALEQLYEDYPDPDHPPVMTDLIAKVEKVLAMKGYSSATRSDMQTAIEVRLGVLAQLTIGTIFRCRHGIDIEHLMKVPSVIELDALPADQACLLTLFILNGIREYLRTVSAPPDGLRYVILIEEAHVIFGSRKTASGSDEIADTQSSIADFISRMLVEFRSLGVGIVLSDQHPSALDVSAYQSVGSILAFRQTYSIDREQLNRSMLLNNSQAQDIARFPPGKALFFTEGYFEALRIITPNLAKQLRLTPPPTDKELREAICEEQWYRSTQEKRISDELGQLKEFMDKYDDQRQIVSSRVNALLKVYGRLLNLKTDQPRSQQMAAIVRELHTARKKLLATYRQFIKGPYRKFSTVTDGLDAETGELKAFAESLNRRFQTVLESGTQDLLRVIDRLIENCMKLRLKETDHAKKK
jgi:hypothetical protein